MAPTGIGRSPTSSLRFSAHSRTSCSCRWQAATPFSGSLAGCSPPPPGSVLTDRSSWLPAGRSGNDQRVLVGWAPRRARGGELDRPVDGRSDQWPACNPIADHGLAVTVPDREIAQATRDPAAAGLYVETSSALALAGTRVPGGSACRLRHPWCRDPDCRGGRGWSQEAAGVFAEPAWSFSLTSYVRRAAWPVSRSPKARQLLARVSRSGDGAHRRAAPALNLVSAVLAHRAQGGAQSDR